MIYSFLPFDAGYTLDFSVRTLPGLLVYDFAGTGPTPGAFAASPTTPLSAVVIGTGIFAGGYFANLASTPVNVFPDADYLVSFHDRNSAGVIVAAAVVTMRAGTVAAAATLSAADLAAIAAAVVAAFGTSYPALGGSTTSSVKLSVPSDADVTQWLGAKLRRLGTSNWATVNGTPSLSGTTATVPVGAGLPAVNVGDNFLVVLP